VMVARAWVLAEALCKQSSDGVTGRNGFHGLVVPCAQEIRVQTVEFDPH
jgi:hypothetical protein